MSQQISDAANQRKNRKFKTVNQTKPPAARGGGKQAWGEGLSPLYVGVGTTFIALGAHARGIIM